MYSQAPEFDFLKKENQLKEYFTAMYLSDNDNSTDSLNNLILSVFGQELDKPESFFYNWSSLNMIGQVKSDDGKVIIYSWYVKTQKGKYNYYGFIQYNHGSQKKPDILSWKLQDKSKTLKNPETLSLDNENWLGCVYFKCFDMTYRGEIFYTLLGYNFNNDYSDKKYIEVLRFDKQDKPVFEGDFRMEFQNVKRVILEYSSQLVASVRWDPKLQMIVMDHLAPFEAMFSGNYRFYGPDGSFDGFRFQKGSFILEKDVDARNN